MGKTTPGPWSVGRMLNPENAPAIIGDEDSVVAILPGDWNHCTYVQDDARLIAAAPDLLSIAQKWAALDGGSWNVARHGREKAELLAETIAAIAAATGETK